MVAPRQKPLNLVIIASVISIAGAVIVILAGAAAVLAVLYKLWELS